MASREVTVRVFTSVYRQLERIRAQRDLANEQIAQFGVGIFLFLHEAEFKRDVFGRKDVRFIVAAQQEGGNWKAEAELVAGIENSQQAPSVETVSRAQTEELHDFKVTMSAEAYRKLEEVAAERKSNPKQILLLGLSCTIRLDGYSFAKKKLLMVGSDGKAFREFILPETSQQKINAEARRLIEEVPGVVDRRVWNFIRDLDPDYVPFADEKKPDSPEPAA